MGGWGSVSTPLGHIRRGGGGERPHPLPRFIITVARGLWVTIRIQKQPDLDPNYIFFPSKWGAKYLVAL